MTKDPTQPMGGVPHYIDDRQMNQPSTSEVQGQPMTEQARHQADIAAQVKELGERANVMQVSIPQLVSLQDNGQINNPLPVPPEFRQHLTNTQQMVTTVQRQTPQAPQIPEGMENHPLVQQAQTPLQPLPQVQAALSQQVAPQGPPVIDQAAMMQAQTHSPDLLADSDLMMGVVPGAIDTDGYETAAQHITQAVPTSQTPATAIPPQTITAKGGNIANLKNSLWSDIDCLLLWESFYFAIIDADRHQLNNPDGVVQFKKRIAAYQQAVDEKGREYLEQIEKRARWRSLLTRNRINFGWNPIQVAQIIKEYQTLLGKIIIPSKQEEPVFFTELVPVMADDPNLLVDESPEAIDEQHAEAPTDGSKPENKPEELKQESDDETSE